MNRRAFFSRVFGGVAAATLAPFLPKLLPAQTLGAVGPAPTVNGLVFHRDAITLVMDDDLRTRYIAPAAARMARDIDTGISIRFIEQFDLDSAVKRMDVLYGMPARPEFACRVVG